MGHLAFYTTKRKRKNILIHCISASVIQKDQGNYVLYIGNCSVIITRNLCSLLWAQTALTNRSQKQPEAAEFGLGETVEQFVHHIVHSVCPEQCDKELS